METDRRVRRLGLPLLLIATLLPPLVHGQDDLVQLDPMEAFLEQEISSQPPATVRRISAEEVSTVQLILGELREQVRVASAKLNPDMLALKRRMGVLRSAIKSTDLQITRLSATLQRLDERRRQLQQDLAGASQPAASDKVAQPAPALVRQLSGPIDSAKARRERLARYRARLQEELNSLRRKHIRGLLTVAVQEDELDALDPLIDIEQFLPSPEARQAQ